MPHDVAIVGAGPAGSSCAVFCATSGLSVLLLERETFPREKVCGDCLNPSCWPVLEKLGIARAVRAAPHGRLDLVEFIAISGRSVRVTLPFGDNAEIAVKRSILDQLLLERARQVGVEIHQNATVTALTREAGAWSITTAAGQFSAKVLVGADGRNSTVARLLNLSTRPQRERVALQSHIPLPANFGNRIVLQLLPEGYSGQAPVNESELNLCLVAEARNIEKLKEWAAKTFAVPPSHPWRTITPLSRTPLSPSHPGVFFIGDAARVVEPFTGEGIFYALRSGELAAASIVRLARGEADESLVTENFKVRHAEMYSGRLWINRLARAAVLSPRVASFFVGAARAQPSLLRLLTAKIVG